MKTFLAIFKCAENSKNHQAWMKLDSQAQKDSMQKGASALEAWALKYKTQIVYEGSALGELTKRTDVNGIHDIPSQMGKFMVVKAQSHEEAAQMFIDHPHFKYFPGDAVEVSECTA
ncbi:hypothetical protein ACES2L_10940 [Bdellovibrio bacteriovorus]